MNKRRAVFFDKDGTLVPDIPYNCDPRRMTFSAGAETALPALSAAGFDLVVVSNQSGVARGMFPEGALACVSNRLRELAGGVGVSLAGVYYCVHHPEAALADYRMACDCRKPQPGMLKLAAQELNIELESSWMVGDILDDVEAGRAAGAHTVLIDNGNETEWVLRPDRVPHHSVADLSEAAAVILALGARTPEGATL